MQMQHMEVKRSSHPVRKNRRTIGIVLEFGLFSLFDHYCVNDRQRKDILKLPDFCRDSSKI